VPYLLAAYGNDFLAKAPVLLLEQLFYGLKNYTDQQVCPLGVGCAGLPF